LQSTIVKTQFNDLLVMKKLVFLGVFTLTVVGAQAQNGAVVTAVSYQQQGLLDKAKEKIDQATYRGIAADQTGLYSKLDENAAEVSYDAYQKATEVEPGSNFAKKAEEALAQMHLSVGGAKYQAEKFEEALVLFNKAKEANPQDTVAVLYAGITAQQLKNYDEAAKNFEQLIQMGTNMPDIYTTVASIYRSKEENDKALDIIQKGLQKFPQDKTMKAEEFNLYVATGKTEEAKANLEEAVKREPDNATYHLNLGILHDQTGDKEKAAASYKRALEVEPDNFDANLSLGVLSYNRGADLSKKINDMDLKTYQKEGKKLEEELKVHFKEALPYFEKAYQLNPSDMSVLQPLASIYNILDMKDKRTKIESEIEAMN
jgi:tetratricopeptide (TPR) repeat protein